MNSTNGHRWTDAELKKLMDLWQAETPMAEMSAALGVTGRAISHIVLRLRRNGIPLRQRNRGHIAGRVNKPWTQAEVEYLVRRRRDHATAEEIGAELGRTLYGVTGMIIRLRSESIHVERMGQGKRRLWSPEMLMAHGAGDVFSVN